MALAAALGVTLILITGSSRTKGRMSRLPSRIPLGFCLAAFLFSMGALIKARVVFECQNQHAHCKWLSGYYLNLASGVLFLCLAVLLGAYRLWLRRNLLTTLSYPTQVELSSMLRAPSVATTNQLPKGGFFDDARTTLRRG
eukprot:GEMP01059712.1.p1 GENE.GEMP01059712.1~~GEMP01059712.1.p1  ORF type:complete len:141 (+),score=23.72 GEMP01059712.1:301-723(+)